MTRRPGMSTEPIITRLPFEDLRELWYWGTWKEVVGRGLGYDVIVICTSVAACRRYLQGQTTDHWLLVDIGEAEPGSRPELADHEIFKVGAENRCHGSFTKLSLAEVVEAVGHDTIQRSFVVLVNPRYESTQSEISADAIYPDSQAFQRALSRVVAQDAPTQ